MRIILVTQDEPFFIRHFFSRFLSNFPSENIAGIVIQPPLNKKSKTAIIKQAMGFFGLTGFIRMGFKAFMLLITDRTSGFLGISSSASVRSIARSHDIRILNHESVNSPEFLDLINSDRVDLVVSVAASEIFRREIITAPESGCINIHSSPLPKHRGMMPNFWALYNGEEMAHVTIHRITERLDDGPILLQKGFRIKPGESYVSLAERSKAFDADLLIECLDLMEKGELSESPNDSSKATYNSFPTPEVIKDFKRRGGRIV